MQTFVVEVLDEKAIPLLHDLENLDIIRLLPQKESAQLEETLRPSERLRGSISKELAADLHRQLEGMRNEWERDI